MKQLIFTFNTSPVNFIGLYVDKQGTGGLFWE